MVKAGLLKTLIDLIAPDEVTEEESKKPKPKDTTRTEGLVNALNAISGSVESKVEEKDSFYLDFLQDLLEYKDTSGKKESDFKSNTNSNEYKLSLSPRRKKEDWMCTACTYLNEGTSTECSMCGSPQEFSSPPSTSTSHTMESSTNNEMESPQKIDESENKRTTQPSPEQTNKSTPGVDGILSNWKKQADSHFEDSPPNASYLSIFRSTPNVDPPTTTSTTTTATGNESVDAGTSTTSVENAATIIELHEKGDTATPEKESPSHDVTAREEEDTWACVACTFINTNMNSESCEICNTPRPLSPPPTSSSTASSTPGLTTVAETGTDVTTNTAEDHATLASSTQSNNKAEEDKSTNTDKAEEASTSGKKKLSTQQIIMVLDVLRHFHVKYQQEMISYGLLKHLAKLIENQQLQNEVMKTISYFDESHQQKMIKEGIFNKLLELLSRKNAKGFLLAIEKFTNYQEEIMKGEMLYPLIKLLSVDDVSIQTRISNFIMNFQNKFRNDIMEEIRNIAKVEEVADVCKLCGGIAGHLTTCKLRTKSMKFSPILSSTVNYGLLNQTKKLLWQLENKGLRLLKYRIIYNDGGEYSKKFRVNNVKSPQSSVYSSESVPVVNLVFEYEGQGIPLLTHAILKAPKSRFDSPVKTAIVFVSENPPDIKASKKYDKLTPNEFSQLFKKEKLEDTDPVAFLDLGESPTYAESPLRSPAVARYVHFKLLTAVKKNFDVEYIGFVGTSVAQPHDVPPLISNLDPCKIEDVGNFLGVRKRVKRFDYVSDFDANGLLCWVGTNGGEKPWENPVSLGQVSITTSHAMYSQNMKVEDIISREGGTSCYWGGTCPQYFVLDLKQRRFKCNYFTLRHGYQAANSYIQNWEFAGSHDMENWFVLFEGGETPFSRAFDTKSWPIPDGKDYFRYFRVLQKGNYSMGKGTSGGGSAYLCIAGLELYGELLRD